MITGPTWPDSGAAGLFVGCFHTGHDCFALCLGMVAPPSPLVSFHIIHFVLYLITITYEHWPIQQVALRDVLVCKLPTHKKKKKHLLNTSMDKGVFFTLETPTFTVYSLVLVYVHSRLPPCSGMAHVRTVAWKGGHGHNSCSGGDKAWHACVCKCHLNWTLGSVPRPLVWRRHKLAVWLAKPLPGSQLRHPEVLSPLCLRGVSACWRGPHLSLIIIS